LKVILFNNINHLGNTEMITLSEKWHDPKGGLIFPAGTVFIEQRVLTKGRGTVYTWGTPGGARGEALFDEGMIPGGSNS
jgi:hypothetical protein